MKKSTINKLNSLLTTIKDATSELETIVLSIEDEAGTPTKPVVRKVKFAENVSLYQKDYDLLVNTFGETATKEMVAMLSAYKLQNNRRYRNDFGAIRNWVINAWGKRTGKNVSPAMLKVELFHTPENTAPDVRFDDTFDVPPERQ